MDKEVERSGLKEPVETNDRVDRQWHENLVIGGSHANSGMACEDGAILALDAVRSGNSDDVGGNQFCLFRSMNKTGKKTIKSIGCEHNFGGVGFN